MRLFKFTDLADYRTAKKVKLTKNIISPIELF